jgi:ribose transport system ATP-binding protein
MSSEKRPLAPEGTGDRGTLGRVEITGVSKSYPGVQALKDVTLTLRPGTVTVIAGENGAGKSTFIKMLSGAEIADTGTVELDGLPLPTAPGEVIDAGVSVIYQELTDIPDMTVFENLFLARMPAWFGWVRRRDARMQAKAALARVGLDRIDIDQPMRQLSMAQRQLVEIARGLTRRAKVLIFDEPTSSLPEKDVRGLLQIVHNLREQGVTIVYVSHHLDELFEVADQIAVLRDGQLVADAPVGEWTEDRLVKTMLAKDLEHAYPWRERELGQVRLQVSGLEAPGIHHASITVRCGEIVGLVGLAGAGRTELLKAVAGATPRAAGNVSIDGRPAPHSPHGAVASGIVYVSEDRKREGLVLEASVEDNIAYGLYPRFSKLGWINRGRMNRFADHSIQQFGVKTRNRRQAVGGLSGGNQQKVVLARVAGAEPKIVLLDDPTRGVDVGAKAGIHEHVLTLAEGGAAVVITSSDTDEVLAVADRIYVLRSGRIVGEVARSDFDRERALHLAAAG